MMHGIFIDEKEQNGFSDCTADKKLEVKWRSGS